VKLLHRKRLSLLSKQRVVGSSPARGTCEDVFEQMVGFALSERYGAVKSLIHQLGDEAGFLLAKEL